MHSQLDNYEDGVPRFLKVIDLAKEYGASVVIGTIDEDGMAAPGQKLISRGVLMSRRLKKRTLRSDIFFDPLALPISTGIEEDRRNALETIEAIRDQEGLPGAFHHPGVSNVSFGLSPLRDRFEFGVSTRAVEAGLDSAIVNAARLSH
jgi:5-methyltetrahydrofolate--homocysteine methyltransferase